MKKFHCNKCYFSDFCNQLKRLPFYKEVKVSKSIMSKLPECFQQTPLGEPRGELRQYRGPHGSHVLEYKRNWVFHRDKVDPRFDPVGHLIIDAPHVILLGSLFALALLGVALAIGGEKE